MAADSAGVLTVKTGSDSRNQRRSGRGGESTYWDIEDVQFHCRLGRSTAWRLVRRDDFPSPVIFSPRGVMWPREEVIEFMERRRDPDHYRGKDVQATREGDQAFASRPVRRRD